MATLADLARRLKPTLRDPSLPPLILMTDPVRLPAPEPAIVRLPRGSAVILRHPDKAEQKALANRLTLLCRHSGVRLLIAGDPRLALEVGADGLHLPERLVAHADRTWRLWRRPSWLVTAAAHSPSAVMRAARAGVDAVLLSPVFQTLSHPETTPLGPLRFVAWVHQSPVPVYALGGITATSARRLAASGAVGFAAIGALQASSSSE